MAKQKKAGLPRTLVTYQPGKGFKKMVGWCVGKAGQRQPKIWWLGHNERQAKLLASMITALYGTVRDDGLLGKCWDDESVAFVKSKINAQRESWRVGQQDAQRFLADVGSDNKGPLDRSSIKRSFVTSAASTDNAEKTLYQAFAAYTTHLTLDLLR